MKNEIQSRVAQAIWPWRDVSKVGTGSSGPGVRRRCVVQSAVTLIAGLLLLFVFRKVWLGYVVLLLAAVTLLSVFFTPPVFRCIERGGRILARGVMIGLTWILLAPFFYVCFIFGRLCLLLMRKDPLCRKFPSDEKSYWVPRSETGGSECYRRQY